MFGDLFFRDEFMLPTSETLVEMVNDLGLLMSRRSTTDVSILGNSTFPKSGIIDRLIDSVINRTDKNMYTLKFFKKTMVSKVNRIHRRKNKQRNSRAKAKRNRELYKYAYCG